MLPEVTVTLPREVFYEVCGLLQLMCVLDVRLHMTGCHPKMPLLKQAWDVFCCSGLQEQPNQEQPNQ